MNRVNHVNTTDIRDAIRLGCRTMSRIFNADDNDIPFFGSRVRPEARLSFSAGASESHVPGRHLNALLNAEDAAGISVDETAIEKHGKAAFFSYSGDIPLPLNRTEMDGPLVNFRPHNIREGFHALYALAKYRDSDQARQVAEASMEAIFRHWNPHTGWDLDYLQGSLGLDLRDRTFIEGLGRAIGPLVKYYTATGYGPALELAIVLKEKAAGGFFTEGGHYNPDLFGTHTHSTTCVMSSLAQLADVTWDSHLMNRVKAFYDHGLWEIRDELGWVIENSRPEANPDRGEINNSGDIVETALILGRWGYPEYYQDAERIVRGHILPSQLRDIAFIEDPPNPEEEDGKRDVADRHLGAFGFPAPYGHEPLGAESVSFNMDIVGGGVGTLCEVYREISRIGPAGHWVNLLFDHETDAIRVESPYTHDILRIVVKTPGPLFVRIPSWVESQEIKTEGAGRAPRYTNGYLFLSQPPVDRPISIQFPLSEQEITLNHRTRKIRARLRGDSVVAMDNFGANLTFFDPID